MASLAIAALMMGILSLVGSAVFLGVIVGPAAAIMGFIAHRQVASSAGTLGGGGVAIGGLILGAIGLVASIGWAVVLLLVVGWEIGWPA